MVANKTALRRWGPLMIGFALGSASGHAHAHPSHSGRGCGQHAGPNSDLVGAACRNDGDCVERCLRGDNFPDGTCSVRCDHDDECPDGTWCVETSGGVCLVACDVDADCGREHYDCRSRDREGAGGERRVCVD